MHQKTSSLIRSLVPEARFREKCLEILKQGYIFVRQLQEEVLNFLSGAQEENHQLFQASIRDTNFFKPDRPVIEYKYNHSYSTGQKYLEEQLTRKLRCRSRQILGNLPPLSMGLNAVLIKGETGVGKSTIVEEILHKRSKESWIKLDASLSISRQKAILCDAFRQGLIIWIDEINSLLNIADDHESGFLEKYLNAMLTGIDPETGTPVREDAPLCFVIATANQADCEGRENLSPALQNRFIAWNIPSTKNYRLTSSVSTSAMLEENLSLTLKR